VLPYIFIFIFYKSSNHQKIENVLCHVVVVVVSLLCRVGVRVC
jgi:hypothetical protein